MAENETAAKILVAELANVTQEMLPVLAFGEDRSSAYDDLRIIQTVWAQIVQTRVRASSAFDDDRDGGEFVDLYQTCLQRLNSLLVIAAQTKANALERTDSMTTLAGCSHQWWPLVRLAVANANESVQHMGPTAHFFEGLAVDICGDSPSDGGLRKLPTYAAINAACTLARWVTRLMEYLQRCTDQDLIAATRDGAIDNTKKHIDRLITEGRTYTATLEAALSTDVVFSAIPGGPAVRGPPGVRRSECDDVVALVMTSLMAATTTSIACLTSDQMYDQSAFTGHTCTEPDESLAADMCTRILQTAATAVSRLQIFTSSIILARKSGLATAVSADPTEPPRAGRLREGDVEVLTVTTGLEQQSNPATLVSSWANMFTRIVAASFNDPSGTLEIMQQMQRGAPMWMSLVEASILMHIRPLAMRVSTTTAARAPPSPTTTLPPADVYPVGVILLYVLELIDRLRVHEDAVAVGGGDETGVGDDDAYLGIGSCAHVFVAARQLQVTDVETLLTAVGLSYVLVTQASMSAQVTSTEDARPLTVLANTMRDLRSQFPQLQQRLRVALPREQSPQEATERALALLAQADVEARMASVRTVLRGVGAFQFQTDPQDCLCNVGSLMAYLHAMGQMFGTRDPTEQLARCSAPAMLYNAAMTAQTTILLHPTTAAVATATPSENPLRALTTLVPDIVRNISSAGWATTVAMARPTTERLMAQTGQSIDQAWTARMDAFPATTTTRLHEAYYVIIHILTAAVRRLVAASPGPASETPDPARDRRLEASARLLVDSALAETARRSLALAAIAETRTPTELRNSLTTTFSGSSLQYVESSVADMTQCSMPEMAGFLPRIGDQDLPTGSLTPLMCNSAPGREAMTAVSEIYAMVLPMFADCGPELNKDERPVHAAWLTSALVHAASRAAVQALQPLDAKTQLSELTVASVSLATGTSDPGGMNLQPWILAALRLIHGRPRSASVHPTPSQIGQLDEACAAVMAHVAWSQIVLRPYIDALTGAHLMRQLVDTVLSVLSALKVARDTLG